MESDAPSNFFDVGSPYLGHPLLTPERSAAEVEWICSKIGSTERVLDLGCGFGRHAIAFAARGSQVVGVDPSATMVAAAVERSQAAGVVADFVRGDAAEFVADAPFDLALLLFTTLGQLPSADAPSSHKAVLASAYAAVRPDGHIVVEVPERNRAVAALVEHEELGPTTVTRSFDAERSVLREQFATPNGHFDLAYRLFSQGELVAAVEAAGFVIEEVTDEGLMPPPPNFMTLFAYRS